MNNQFTEKEILDQKKRVFAENPSLHLVAPCRTGEGILRLNEGEKQQFRQFYSDKNPSVCFFIPASGSGSRMFQFLYDFLEEPNDENRSSVERFLNSIEDFAFFRQIPREIQRKIQTQDMDFEEIANFLLDEAGLGYGHLPKGLIPFHHTFPFILNPFQEQILQGMLLENDRFAFHFTVQKKFEDQIKNGIEHIEGLSGSCYSVSFSEQQVATNSIAFTEEGEICFDKNDEMVTRPSGHGALLPHLNRISEEVIFIKNIDNVQHISNSDAAIETWKLLGGMLLELKDELHALIENPSFAELNRINEKYQLYSTSELDNCDSEASIRSLINRPLRICGMVKNEGQPGGGPFWVEENGVTTKQIVEKAQITMKGDQYKLMVQSTHFNPVMIALSSFGPDGSKFDLEQYSDPSKYFIVKKRHHGQKVRYIELPGLWNGGMAKWNTVFVEISSKTFSPVKTVLDLLDDSHKA